MILKSLMKQIFRTIQKVEKWSSGNAGGAEESIYVEEPPKEEEKTIISVWDILQFRENTQAYHLNSVIGFEEWVEMEEIRRRIKDIFGADYKNKRSLYPYLKTLVDLGLMETTSIGGRGKWRKVPLLVQSQKKEEKKETVIISKQEKKKEVKY